MKKKKKTNYVKIQYPIGHILQRIILHVYGDRGFILSRIEEILYDDVIVSDFYKMDMVLSNGHKRDTIMKFITAFSDARLSKPVGWLFKHRVDRCFPIGDGKDKQLVDVVFVNIIKEVIWMSYYLSTKAPNRLVVVGSPQDILSRLTGVYIDPSYPAKLYDISRDKYIENVLSLKDSHYGFLPHPEHIDPDDLERLLIENNPTDKNLFDRIRRLYEMVHTPDSRYYTFKELRDEVKCKLEEIQDGTTS